MKTRTLSLILSAIVICGMLFFVQKELSCQSSQFNVEEAAAQASVVSIPDPALFPNASPLFSEMWGKPEYVVLKEIPVGVRKHFLGQPVLTDNEIYVPVIQSQPGVLIYNRAGTLKHHIRFDSLQETALSDIRIYPEIQEILVGDHTHKAIKVYDLSGQYVEDRNVGFHFLSFTYSPELKRYLFYLLSDGAVATAANPPDAITITDSAFKVLHSLFPLSTRAIQTPYFTGGRFRNGDHVVYYNPDFSDQLYTIDFNGKVELILDLQIADADYYHRLDSLLLQVNNMDYFIALGRGFCINQFAVTANHIIAGTIPGQMNKDLIVNRHKHQGILINNSILMTNFGDQFNFGYAHPDFAANGAFLFFLTGIEFNKMMSYLPPSETTSHLPQFLEDNQWLLMIFNPNDEVFFPGIEKPAPESQVSMNVYPNPANESVNVQVAGPLKSIRIDVFSTDGTIRYTASNTEGETGMAREIDVADWSPGAYVVKCTTPHAVYARTLMVQ